jgi:hypothetical protein
MNSLKKTPKKIHIGFNPGNYQMILKSLSIYNQFKIE